jgi:antitoxin (DNA-binding transcriptional repressor) of toxin-antitoxin stability system
MRFAKHWTKSCQRSPRSSLQSRLVWPVFRVRFRRAVPRQGDGSCFQFHRRPRRGVAVARDVKRVYPLLMKTITVRHLRQRWPEAEASLQVEKEILITRDSRPVAKLVRVTPPETKRKRWNPDEHAARIRKILGDKTLPSVGEDLSKSRADRLL